MNTDLLFIVGIPGLFFVFIIFIFLFAIRESKRTISKLSMVLPEAGKIHFHFHPSGTANHGGQKYNYLYYAGSRNSPCRLAISIDVNSLAQFRIVKETKTDGFFKKLGINQELQTGDFDFDQKYYILSGANEFVSDVLREQSSRDTFRFVFETGFTEISLKDGKLEAEWQGFSFPANVQSESIARVIDALRRIAKNIPEQSPAMVIASKPSRMSQLARYAVHAIPFILGVAGFIFLVMADLPLDGQTFFFKSLFISLPSLLALVFFASKFLRGRASSGREVLFFSVVAVISMPLFVYGYGVYLNCKTDHSSVIRHEVLVLSKRVEKSKSSTSYYMNVASWRDARGAERLRVSRDFFQQVQPSESRVEIASRSGALRYEWVESYSLID